MQSPQRPLIIAASVLGVFIVLMIALAVAFSGGGNSSQQSQKAAPKGADVETLGNGTVDKDGRFNGKYLAFDIPPGAKKFQSEVTGENESVSFQRGAVQIEISTQNADPGTRTLEVASGYGSAPQQVQAGKKKVYEARLVSGRQFSVLLVDQYAGRYVLVEALTTTSKRSQAVRFARQSRAGLKVARRVQEPTRSGGRRK